MNPIEVRLVLYLVLLLAAGWGGYTLASHHDERLAQAKQLAQDAVVQKAQSDVIAAQSVQKAAENRADQETQKREQADTLSRDAVLGSVHNLEAAVNRHLLPTAVANSGTVHASQSGAIDAPRLAELVGRFNSSLDRFIGACQNDSADRAAILSLEPLSLVSGER